MAEIQVRDVCPRCNGVGYVEINLETTDDYYSVNLNDPDDIGDKLTGEQMIELVAELGSVEFKCANCNVSFNETAMRKRRRETARELFGRPE